MTEHLEFGPASMPTPLAAPAHLPIIIACRVDRSEGQVIDPHLQANNTMRMRLDLLHMRLLTGKGERLH
jgi:hypothetical protein